MYLTRRELRTCAGNLVICGFAGRTLDAELRELLREIRPLGVIFFARNIESPAAAGELCRELKMHVPPEHPLLCSVDQEGGRVARLKEPLTCWPPMRHVGQHGDPAAARAVGEALARELRALNFDIDFAPVVDVDTNPNNPVIGDRSFSRDPTQVSTLASAFIDGMQAAGIAACAKHFPGHGDTDLDSHLALPHINHDLARLRKIEWPPFAAAIQANVSSIMTAHVVMHAFDEEVPATLSKTALQTHLREELQFKGIIVSDDIEMKALADHYAPETIAEQGLRAGIDVFLACHKYEVTLSLYRALIQAAERDQRLHQTIFNASQRATRWRQSYYQPPHAGTQSLSFHTHAALATKLKAT